MQRGKFGTMRSGEPPISRRKVRDIRYCAHIDRCVYQRYAFLIDAAYNRQVKNTPVDECAIAYRTNKGRSNIDYAKEVFSFIEKQESCVIVVSDFADFFEGVDHLFLKRALCEVLNCSVLPPDYYAVFKNSTRYSCWEWKDLLELNGLANDHSARKKMNERETILPYEIFKQQVKGKTTRNDTGHGIPQGSPLSAVLSNVYLKELDGDLSTLVGASGDLYRRYCDDVPMVLPVANGDVAGALSDAKRAYSLIASYPGVRVQQEKTKSLLFLRLGEVGSLFEVDRKGRVADKPTRLDYLGFSFDGANIRIRAKTVGKYYYRMGRKARVAVRQGRGFERLYARYSEKSWDIDGKGSFVDYAKRAMGAMDLEDPTALSIAKHSMEKIAKARNRASEE
ncbi:reverse transcriptase domain-containing protein [Adlercreutzia sp. ZJ242]|uniref:reverse transcriptase domain-containing protein n=1 Tax=Adlercreutzia sp. ZJ242 TaxID=2709409 RepID=UPI00197ED737|nr:reverse transcriptase domain-containing protein [Adlercreutzia sp. ZJ242]